MSEEKEEILPLGEDTTSKKSHSSSATKKKEHRSPAADRSSHHQSHQHRKHHKHKTRHHSNPEATVAPSGNESAVATSTDSEQSNADSSQPQHKQKHHHRTRKHHHNKKSKRAESDAKHKRSRSKHDLLQLPAQSTASKPKVRRVAPNFSNVTQAALPTCLVDRLGSNHLTSSSSSSSSAQQRRASFNSGVLPAAAESSNLSEPATSTDAAQSASASSSLYALSPVAVEGQSTDAGETLLRKSCASLSSENWAEDDHKSEILSAVFRASFNPTYHDRIAQSAVLAGLVYILGTREENLLISCLCILVNLSVQEKHRSELRSAGVLQVLLPLIRNAEDREVLTVALELLVNLATDSQNRTLIARLQLIPQLLAFATSSEYSNAIRSTSFQVISNLIHESSILDMTVKSEEFGRLEQACFWREQKTMVSQLPSFLASICWSNASARERFARQDIVDAMANEFVNPLTDISTQLHIIRFLLLYSDSPESCALLFEWCTRLAGVLPTLNQDQYLAGQKERAKQGRLTVEYLIQLLSNATYHLPSVVEDLTDDVIIFNLLELYQTAHYYPAIMTQVMNLLVNMSAERSGRSALLRNKSFGKIKSEISAPRASVRSGILAIQTNLRLAHQETSELSMSFADLSSANDDHTKMLSHRGNLMDELILSEKSYVEVLLILVQVFVKCEKTAKYGVPDEKRILTFGPLLELSKIHSRLLSTLQQRAHGEKVVISDLFTEFAANLRLYEQYILSYEQYLEWADKPAFRKYLEREFETLGVKKSVYSLLIAPIQRIPRYTMMLQELLQCTPQGSTEYNKLVDAHTALIAATDELEQQKQFQQGSTDILQVASRLSRLPFDIAMRGRELILEQKTEIEYRTMSSGKPRQLSEGLLFLFNDLLLITKIRAADRFRVTNVFRLATLEDEELSDEYETSKEDSAENETDAETVEKSASISTKPASSSASACCVLLRDPSQAVRCWIEKSELKKFVRTIDEQRAELMTQFDSSADTQLMRFRTGNEPGLKALGLHNTQRAMIVSPQDKVSDLMSLIKQKMSKAMTKKQKSALKRALTGHTLFETTPNYYRPIHTKEIMWWILQTNPSATFLLLPILNRSNRKSADLSPYTFQQGSPSGYTSSSGRQASSVTSGSGAGIGESTSSQQIKPSQGDKRRWRRSLPAVLGGYSSSDRSVLGDDNPNVDSNSFLRGAELSTDNLHAAKVVLARVFLPDNTFLRQVGLNNTFKTISLSSTATVPEVTELLITKLCKAMTPVQREVIHEQCKSYRLWEISDSFERKLVPEERPLEVYMLKHDQPHWRFMFKPQGTPHFQRLPSLASSKISLTSMSSGGVLSTGEQHSNSKDAAGSASSSRSPRSLAASSSSSSSSSTRSRKSSTAPRFSLQDQGRLSSTIWQRAELPSEIQVKSARLRKELKEFLWEDPAQLTAAQVLLQVRELVGGGSASEQTESSLLEKSLRSAQNAEEAILWAQYGEGLLRALLRLLEQNEVALNSEQEEAFSNGKELLRAVQAPMDGSSALKDPSSSGEEGPQVSTRLDHEIVQRMSPRGDPASSSSRKSVFGLFEQGAVPSDILASVNTLQESLRVLAKRFDEFWFAPVRVLERRFNTMNAHIQNTVKQSLVVLSIASSIIQLLKALHIHCIPVGESESELASSIRNTPDVLFVYLPDVSLSQSLHDCLSCLALQFADSQTSSLLIDDAELPSCSSPTELHRRLCALLEKVEVSMPPQSAFLACLKLISSETIQGVNKFFATSIFEDSPGEAVRGSWNLLITFAADHQPEAPCFRVEHSRREQTHEQLDFFAFEWQMAIEYPELSAHLQINDVLFRRSTSMQTRNHVAKSCESLLEESKRRRLVHFDASYLQRKRPPPKPPASPLYSHRSRSRSRSRTPSASDSPSPVSGATDPATPNTIPSNSTSRARRATVASGQRRRNAQHRKLNVRGKKAPPSLPQPDPAVSMSAPSVRLTAHSSVSSQLSTSTRRSSTVSSMPAAVSQQGLSNNSSLTTVEALKSSSTRPIVATHQSSSHGKRYRVLVSVFESWKLRIPVDATHTVAELCIEVQRRLLKQEARLLEEMHKHDPVVFEDLSDQEAHQLLEKRLASLFLKDHNGCELDPLDEMGDVFDDNELLVVEWDFKCSLDS